jgi:hypothetical protein
MTIEWIAHFIYLFRKPLPPLQGSNRAWFSSPLSFHNPLMGVFDVATAFLNSALHYLILCSMLMLPVPSFSHPLQFPILSLLFVPQITSDGISTPLIFHNDHITPSSDGPLAESILDRVD